MLPVILVEFGRMLWEAYARSLAEEAGKSLAAITLDKVKELARRTWSGRDPAIPLSEVEARLRAAAERARLDPDETERLVASLRSPEAVHSLSRA